MADHGSDFSGVTTLDRNLTIVTGRRCLIENAARRLLAPPGSEPDDPTYGLGIDQQIGEDSSATFFETEAEEQMLADERVESAEVVATFDDDTGKISLAVQIDDGDGPFGFTVDPNGLSVDQLMLRSS